MVDQSENSIFMYVSIGPGRNAPEADKLAEAKEEARGRYDDDLLEEEAPRQEARKAKRGSRGPRDYGGRAAPSGAPAPRRPSMAAPAAPPPPPQMTAGLLEKSFTALVSGSRVGSLFRYDIEAPVTIRDRQSALVAILNKKVPAEDVLLFRMDVPSSHPYRAVRLTNNTGYMIEKGPVAIYHEGSFVGEAVTGQVEAKECYNPAHHFASTAAFACDMAFLDCFGRNV